MPPSPGPAKTLYVGVVCREGLPHAFTWPPPISRHTKSPSPAPALPPCLCAPHGLQGLDNRDGQTAPPCRPPGVAQKLQVLPWGPCVS